MAAASTMRTIAHRGGQRSVHSGQSDRVCEATHTRSNSRLGQPRHTGHHRQPSRRCTGSDRQGYTSQRRARQVHPANRDRRRRNRIGSWRARAGREPYRERIDSGLLAGYAGKGRGASRRDIEAASTAGFATPAASPKPKAPSPTGCPMGQC